ncbi:hypothetical protein BSKO_09848 [Bryopsis sp. KO-2023]|nr:hypothetical protein BSKO_09848 [Bryopsis sp. KO-2023]
MRFSVAVVFIAVALFFEASCGVEAGRWSHGRGLTQFCLPQRSRDIGPAIGAIYMHPEIDGVKVDYCLSPGNGCGKMAADAFCRRNGYGFSDSYVVWQLAGITCGSTVAVESGESCVDDCRGFRIISCAGGSEPTLLGTILGTGPSNEKKKRGGRKDKAKGEPAVVEDNVQEDTTDVTDVIPETTPELLPEQTIPAETTLGETTPVETTPVETTPAETTPAETTPAETAPVETTFDSAEQPADPIALQTVPSEDGSGEAEGSETQKEEESQQDAGQEPLKENKKNQEGKQEGTQAPPSENSGENEAPNSEASSSTTEETSEDSPSDGDPLNGANILEDGSIEIEHPDLGNVKLPGEEGANESKSVKKKNENKQENAQAQASDPGGQSPGSGGQDDAVSCQTRGAQSAIAAARVGCSVVVDTCATNEAALKSQQDSINGSAGRRLTQEAVEREECRELFSSECQAAAFDNADGLCSILMGNGPNPGEEQDGCSDAEQARSVFKASVKQSCDKFLNGAFPEDICVQSIDSLTDLFTMLITMKTIVVGNVAPAARPSRSTVSRSGPYFASGTVSSLAASVCSVEKKSEVCLVLFAVVSRVQKSQRRSLVITAAVAADSSLDIATMEPLGERVLVKPMEIEEKSEGGILLPSSATEQEDSAKFGEVIAVGDGVELGVSKGDKVIYVSESVAHVEVSDGEITFVSGKSILATMS